MRTTDNRLIYFITPVVAFALTLIISTGISNRIEHRHAASDRSESTEEMISGSYRSMFESLNSVSTR